MRKQHYFFKLIPPRPTFPQDMTDDERRLMDEHGRYFQDQFAGGKILLFGPVMATAGAFGLPYSKWITKMKPGGSVKATRQ